MDVDARVDAPCTVHQLFALVDDLGTYPRWLDLTHRCTPLTDGAVPAWEVELRARLGPLARSKRLRMERTVREIDATRAHARFERVELDGRHHAPWVLDATVTRRTALPDAAPSAELRMALHYGGRLWTGGVLERALGEQITRGRARLLELVAATH